MKKVRRVFAPGSRWLYFKIYGGTSVIDKIISRNILSYIEELYSIEIINKWFFIRYNEYGDHIRLRILLCQEKYVGAAIQSFHRKFEPMIKTSLISKLQIDTYNRELERYNENFIEDSESLFCIDSEYVAKIIKIIKDTGDENYRWMISLKMIDVLLSDFNYSIFQKQKLLQDISNSFKREFGFGKYNSKQFNDKYRFYKKDVETILDNRVQDKSILKMIDLLKLKSLYIQPIAQSINRKAVKHNLNLDFLLNSYIHMMFNRLFPARQRQHELIIYDFLVRYYMSKIAQMNIK
jgi:thiopeptide-type bacteriocin biosynthesis protein